MYLLLAASRTNNQGASGTTWNPNDKGSGVTLSNNNLTATMVNGYAVRGTVGHSTGKWLYEIKLNQLDGTASPVVGIATTATVLNWPWTSTGEFTFYSQSSSVIIWNNNQRSSYGSVLVTNDVLGIAYDATNRTLTFYKNGVSMGTAFTSATIPAGTYYPMVSSPAAGATTVCTASFGNFHYPVAGYSAW
jgi:hypothetical protein